MKQEDHHRNDHHYQQQQYAVGVAETSEQHHVMATVKSETDAETGMQASNTKRGSLQLWQFLLHLLSAKNDGGATNGAGEPIIEWTRKSEAEFKLLDPEEVARLWGVQKNRPTMNYDKLSRSLRYYYEKGNWNNQSLVLKMK